MSLNSKSNHPSKTVSFCSQRHAPLSLSFKQRLQKYANYYGISIDPFILFHLQKNKGNEFWIDIDRIGKYVERIHHEQHTSHADDPSITSKLKSFETNSNRNDVKINELMKLEWNSFIDTLQYEDSFNSNLKQIVILSSRLTTKFTFELQKSDIKSSVRATYMYNLIK